ncbi:hypothetical protein BJ878DRAFT_429253 [Calycina marina]|uniref:F-box domain-containing protein n=1 Tax=Calycina marina TaxID=1763456 RepID=A0A9P7YWF1_9HELO|nr:hypothetical protein BJ878DRAFT_429253 [Calycina marina]
MKWPFSRKRKVKNSQGSQDVSSTQNPPTFVPRVSDPRLLAQLLSQVPEATWQRIFRYVCPHAGDDTYKSNEQSAQDDCCMLCDLRDLAHCAQVSRKWNKLATKIMYFSIRIDAVHYCPLEAVLAEKRKRKSKFNVNGEPEDTAQARVSLLCRTLRDRRDDFGTSVQFIKLPFMTREVSKADMARTITVTPNLRYIDLPEGVYQDEPSFNILKQGLQGRCRDIRKMAYKRGSERSLEALASGRLWGNLEVLELSELTMDPAVFRYALGSLYSLRALKITDMVSFHNQLLEHNERLPPFPALEEMIFINVPNLTVDGLGRYLSRSDTQKALKILSLEATGVNPSALQQILSQATNLKHLTIIETVSTSFPIGSKVDPLASTSLETLNYEISLATDPNIYAGTIEGYYSFLTSSLIANRFPALRELYVRDPDFPESLLDLAPPVPAFASDPDNSTPKSLASFHDPKSNTNRFSSNNPFASRIASPLTSLLGMKQALVVYSKGLDEEEWNFSRVKPANENGKRGSASLLRPVSSYGLNNGLANPWTEKSGARQSVIVGNGFGGFLTVPAEGGPRPSSSACEKGHRRKGSSKSQQYDIWR